MFRLNQLPLTIVSLIIVGWLSLPSVVLADEFVTCDGTDCSFCNLVDMGNNILVWLIGIIFVIFAIMVFVSGFGLLISSGNPDAKNRARVMLINALFGLAIVLTSWIIIDMIMKEMLKDKDGKIDGHLFWAKVECLEQTKTHFVDNYRELSTGGIIAGNCDMASGECDALAQACVDYQTGATAAIEPVVAGQGIVTCTLQAGSDAGNACDESKLTSVSVFGGHSVTVHEGIASALKAASSQWESLGGNSYYPVTSISAYNCRKVTGGSGWSMHAYGLAVDINPAANGYVKPKVTPCPTDMNKQSPAFYTILTSRGFGWGGQWNSLCDAMHFSGAVNEGGWITPGN